MRKHDRHARLSPRIDAEAFHEIVAAENLACARLDPAFGLRIDSEGILDLAFAKHGRIVLVPFLLIQAGMLLMRETSPYIWPAWLPPMRESVAHEIESAIDPWIKSLIVGRFADAEALRVIRRRRGRPCVGRARARVRVSRRRIDRRGPARGGAVRLRAAVRSRQAGSDQDAGVDGAAIGARAQSVRADLGDAERNEVARRWFDLDDSDRRAAGAPPKCGSAPTTPAWARPCALPSEPRPVPASGSSR